MKKMIAYCGLVCTDCPAYLATRANDEKKARETADLWAKEYGVKVTVADVWCDGCIVRGKKCAHCAECEIRACGAGRGALKTAAAVPISPAAGSRPFSPWFPLRATPYWERRRRRNPPGVSPFFPG